MQFDIYPIVSLV